MKQLSNRTDGQNIRRVIVTGATSMVGIALIKECIKHNVEVLAIVRKGSTKRKKIPKSGSVEIIEYDLKDLAGFTSERSGKIYDVCYHFAWSHTSKGMRDDPVLQQENIRYTLDAVEMASRLGCWKFVGAGSQAEYGSKKEIIDPDTYVEPQVAYGISKYAAGLLSQKLCRRYGMIHIWGRIFSVYGSNDKEETMLSYAIGQFIKGETAKFSSGVQMWDYLHEDDAGKIFYLLGERIMQDRVYCIASGKPRQLKKFILEMQEVYGAGAECEFAKEDGQQVLQIQADASSLFRDISYMPVISFKEGIKKMINDKLKDVRGGAELNIIKCRLLKKRLVAA